MADKNLKVRFCPKCKSFKVGYVFEMKNLFGILPKMRCEKCGTEMPSFPILVTNKKILAKSGGKKL